MWSAVRCFDLYNNKFTGLLANRAFVKMKKIIKNNNKCKKKHTQSKCHCQSVHKNKSIADFRSQELRKLWAYDSRMSVLNLVRCHSASCIIGLAYAQVPKLFDEAGSLCANVHTQSINQIIRFASDSSVFRCYNTANNIAISKTTVVPFCSDPWSSHTCDSSLLSWCQTNDKVGQFRLPIKLSNKSLSSVMQKSAEFVCHQNRRILLSK